MNDLEKQELLNNMENIRTSIYELRKTELKNIDNLEKRLERLKKKRDILINKNIQQGTSNTFYEQIYIWIIDNFFNERWIDLNYYQLIF